MMTRNAPHPAAPPYPEIGEIPATLEMTACEVLCWIGYGRAIPKETYYHPIGPKTPPNEIAALLHRSVPDPKPFACPMDEAERRLMDALRSGKVHALVDRNDALESVPTEIFNYAVAVNARGSIEPCQDAAGRDNDRAHRYLFSSRYTKKSGQMYSLPKDVDLQRLPIKLVFFRTSEVREHLTPWGKEPPAKTALPACDYPPSPATPKATAPALRNWMQDRVRKWPENAPAPSEADDFKAAKLHFGPKLSRDADLRPIREEHTPPEWRKQGRRKPWGEAKKSAEQIR